MDRARRPRGPARATLLLALSCGCAGPIDAAHETDGATETEGGTDPSDTTSGESTAASTLDDADATGSSGAGTDDSDGSDTGGASSTGDAPQGTVVVRFAFVHGVLGSADAQAGAENEAADMEAYFVRHAPEHVAAYEAEHPGVHVEVETARLNLYTDLEGALLRPGLDEISDGSGIATANRWRAQLALKLEDAFPGEGNIVPIGHSTGARAAMEVAADVGDADGPGSHDWGMGDRIAGVVTLHGMIDALGSPAYDFIGPIAFLTGCKLAAADGWCEYASEISGVAASDWVATHKHALSLVSWASCSPSAWTGQNDKSLPLRAQGSPAVPGMTMTPAAGGTFVPAHGTLYGNFCHSDVTSRSSGAHEAAVAAAMDAVLAWAFAGAERVANPTLEGQVVDTDVLDAGMWSASQARGDGCPEDHVDAGEPLVVGSCLHDGDDHPFDDTSVVEVEDGRDCTGAVRWQHLHEGEAHAARMWMKLPAAPASGGGLVSTLTVQ